MPSSRVNGYDMAYVESGAGTPLVLIHGSIGDYRWWEHQMEPFGAQYRTVAVSLRHCWPERWDGEGDDYTTSQHVSDLVAFISALGAGPVHLLGISRGGRIAFHVARNSPDLIRALVLVEPGGSLDLSLEPADAPTAPPLAFGTIWNEVVACIRRGEIDEGLAPAFDTIVGPGIWEGSSDWFKQIARDNARTLIAQSKEQTAPFTRSDAEAIRSPTLLVAGQRSPETFHRIVQALNGAIPDCQRTVIPRASHSSNYDNPRDFEREVLAFLQQH